MASQDPEVAHQMYDEVYIMAPPPSVDISFSLLICFSMASWDFIKYSTFQFDFFAHSGILLFR